MDSQDNPVWKDGPYDATQSSPTPVSDLFITRLVRIPATLPPGEYRLRIDAMDVASGSEATVSTPLRVSPVAPPPAR